VTGGGRNAAPGLRPSAMSEQEQMLTEGLVSLKERIMATEDRIEKLERSCRHHRRINIGLAILVLLIVSFGAARVEGRYSSLVLE